jgi:hypothetical protein
MADLESSRHRMSLPDEILILIISYLDTISLATIILVSKHFDDLAEPYLYARQNVHRGSHAVALSKAINERAERAHWINSLFVSTKFGDEKGLETLPKFLREMRNLKTLVLETPDCNNRAPVDRISWICLQDRYERIFEQASILAPSPKVRLLPSLEECWCPYYSSADLANDTRHSSFC